MTESAALAQEAARLLGAAQQWLQRAATEPGGVGLATGSPQCCWCPLCQLVAALRGERPELTERLVQALGAVTELQAARAGIVQALREAATHAAAGEDRAGTRQDTGDDGDAAAAAASATEAGRPRLQHIRLSAEGGC